MNLHDWATVIVAIVAVIIAAANPWLLKLYENSKTKAAPTNPPESATHKRQTKTVLIMVWALGSWSAIILWNIYDIHRILQRPGKDANKDALFLAVDVGVIFFGLSMLFTIYVSELILKGLAMHADVIDKSVGITAKLTDVTETTAKAVVELAGASKKRNKKPN